MMKISDFLARVTPYFHARASRASTIILNIVEIFHQFVMTRVQGFVQCSRAEIIRKNTEVVTGIYHEPAGTIASTDQRNFINYAEIPAITWGPGWGKSHEHDEYVEISQVMDCVKILVLTIFDLLK